MPVYNPSYNWVASDPITTAKLNAIFNDMMGLLNLTKLDSSNLASGGVSLGNLATKKHIQTIRMCVTAPHSTSTKTAADFSGFAHTLDKIKFVNTGKILSFQGVAADNGFDTLGASTRARLYLNGGMIPGTEIELAVSVPTVVTGMNQAIAINDVISIRLDKVDTLDQLPVYFLVTFEVDLQVAV